MFHCLQQTNSYQTLQHIEKGNFSEEELVLVKVPVLLPYSSNWNEYERYDGEIEWGGMHYNYVKRKILNDTLYLLCLPDVKRSALEQAHKSYAQQVNDFSAPSQKGKQTSIKTPALANEFVQAREAYNLQAPFIAVKNNYLNFSTPLIFTDSDCIIQPPDVLI